MNINRNILLLACALAVPAAPRAWSAPEGKAPEAAKAEVTTQPIKLKNMTPTMMTLLLSPQPAPEAQPEGGAKREPGSVLSFTRKNGKQTIIRKGTPEGDKFEAEAKAKAESSSAGVFSLPEGVESLTPDDASGELWVRGTAEGIARARDIVSFLDLPLRRVEVEVLSVRLGRVDLDRLTTDNPTGGLKVAFLRGENFKKTLAELQEANQASTLLDVRATMLNNTSGFFSSSPTSMGASYRGPSILSTADVQLTPTINNDDTITMVMQAITKVPPGNTPASATNVQAVVNVRDGQTIALVDAGTEEDTAQVTATFLTPRIIQGIQLRK